MFFKTHNKSKIRRLFSIYLDGELDRERTELLLTHLKECSECRHELQSLEQTHALLLRGLSKQEVPDIRASVYFALERKKAQKTSHLIRIPERIFRPAFIYTTAAAFGIATGVLIFSSMGTTTVTASDPIPISYLSPSPPNSLVTFYYGDTGEAANE
jgi:anti-sigma factor RsiW